MIELDFNIEERCRNDCESEVSQRSEREKTPSEQQRSDPPTLDTDLSSINDLEDILTENLQSSDSLAQDMQNIASNAIDLNEETPVNTDLTNTDLNEGEPLIAGPIDVDCPAAKTFKVTHKVDHIKEACKKLEICVREDYGAYIQYSMQYEGKSVLLRKYSGGEQRLFENIRRLSEDEEIKKRLPEVMWPIAISEYQESGGEFWCLMPSPSTDSCHPLSHFVFPNCRSTTPKNAESICISFVSFLHKCQQLKKYLGYLDPKEIFINTRTGRIHFTGIDHLIDEGSAEDIVRRIEKYNQHRTFISERFMPAGYFADGFSPRMEDLNYYAALFSCILLLHCHPYEGKQWAKYGYMSFERSKELYGTHRQFLLDTKNNENGVTPYLHDVTNFIWDIQPQSIKDMFLRSFSRSKEEQAVQPTVFDWLKSLIYLHNITYSCPSCGWPLMNPDGCHELECYHCSSKIKLNRRIRLKEYVMAASKGARIYRCQLGACDEDDALMPVALILAKDSDPDALGVKNMTDQIWEARTPSGKINQVNPGSVVPFISGIEISVFEHSFKLE